VLLLLEEADDVAAHRAGVDDQAPIDRDLVVLGLQRAAEVIESTIESSVFLMDRLRRPGHATQGRTHREKASALAARGPTTSRTIASHTTTSALARA
jgi:hypothetical protein